jgi:hypothetical protein
VSYIGAPVEDYNALVITAAINLVDRHQIWFYSQDGTMLCYDEYHKIWSIFNGLDTNAATLVNGVPTLVRLSDGVVMAEDKTSVIDHNTRYSCELETQWINLAEVQGYQRMRKITYAGLALNNATITLYRDWSASSFETYTMAGSASQFQYQIKPKIQRSEALKFDISWSNITSSVEIDAFGIEAGFAEGTFRLPAAQRVKGN